MEPVNGKEYHDNYAIRDYLILSAEKKTSKCLYENSFEMPGSGSGSLKLPEKFVHTGFSSFKMDETTEFSPVYCTNVSSLPLQKGKKFGILASIYVNLPGPPGNLNTLFVISFEHNNQSYSYTAVNPNELKLKPGKWNFVSLQTPVPKIKSPDDQLKVYFWNPGKQIFYIDDMKVDLIPAVPNPHEQ
jgi:hypothetical protein